MMLYVEQKGIFPEGRSCVFPMYIQSGRTTGNILIGTVAVKILVGAFIKPKIFYRDVFIFVKILRKFIREG